MANKDDVGGGSGLSDEEWAEFEKQFTKEATKTAAYKEPSARQRELTAKWKKEAPKDTGWRTDGPRAPLTPAKPTLTVLPGGRRKRVWRRNLAWAVLAAVITGLVIGLPKMFPASKGSDGVRSNVPFAGVIPGSTPSASGAPTTAPPSATASSTYANPDDQYFDGSPSIGWADGVAGIVAPPAQKVGGYSAKTVEDAYAALRQMMITVNLDPQVLAGAEPTAMLKLLDPGEGVDQMYAKRIAKPGRDSDPIAFATRFNPKKVALLGKTVKVQGSMSASTNSSGVLTVRADYSFVYALSLADGSGLDRSLVRRVWQLEVPASRSAASSGRYWLYDWWYDIFNDRCDITDGYINPSFHEYGGVNSGKVADPYATTSPPDYQQTPATPTSTPSPGECDGTKPV